MLRNGVGVERTGITGCGRSGEPAWVLEHFVRMLIGRHCHAHTGRQDLGTAPALNFTGELTTTDNETFVPTVESAAMENVEIRSWFG